MSSTQTRTAPAPARQGTQALGTTTYRPRTKGLWASQSGTLILRMPEDMLTNDNALETFVDSGVMVADQPLTLIFGNPAATIDAKVRAEAQRYGIHLPHQPGDRVTDFVDILNTNGVWVNTTTGDAFRIDEARAPSKDRPRVRPIEGRTSRATAYIIISSNPEDTDATLRALAKKYEVTVTF